MSAGISLWAGVTLGLCGVVFGLLQMRKSRELGLEVDRLKHNRVELITLIKQKNARIEQVAQQPPAAEEDGDTSRAARHREVKVQAVPQRYTYARDKLPITFNNGVHTKKLVSLTFDGGASSNATAMILDTLRSRRVRATMFLTGRYMRRNRAFVESMIAQGHDIGNHTQNHPHLTTYAQTRTHRTVQSVSRDLISRELAKANEEFRRLTGTDTAPFWRAPYGETNREINRWARECGYLHVGWRQARTWKQNFDTNDWVPDEETPGYHTPGEVIEKFTSMAQEKPYGMNGAIVLMHLGTVRKKKDQQVHRVLGTLIDRLRELGYRFVTVSVLVQESGVDVSLLRRRT